VAGRGAGGECHGLAAGENNVMDVCVAVIRNSP